MKYWWQEAIVYQVYLRSFKDSNNDGLGDIQGVIEKLDYLKNLGVNTLWISPHYDSPMDDNGYDIRDFYQVSSDYGTIEDFQQLLDLAHQKNMRIITDLVLNHTSDEHEWFKAAKNPNHPKHKQYHDYYIWQKPKYNEAGERIPPTRWLSWFGGPTWHYNEATDEYYLHIFSKKMPDLNWRNIEMRTELKAMIQWWIDLGVDGFRVDASNHLEKNWDFPDAHPGYEHFSSLPKHHEYLEELGRELFIPNNLMVIGEAGGASRKEALQYAGFDSQEFNMLIQFEHCWVDVDPNNQLTPGKWAKGHLDVTRIKKSFNHWIDVFKNKGWNIIYWHNHDQPRIVSHYGDDCYDYHQKSAKMLAFTLYFLPGTPIVYYGEEIGMTNVDYRHLSDFRDVEVFTEYENFIRCGASHDIAMQALRDRSRDTARSPMQWDNTLYGGFSEHMPWIPINNNYEVINVKRQISDETSIYNTYKRLLDLRKQEKIAFADVEFYDLDHPRSFNYLSSGTHHDYLVLANFSSDDLTMTIPIDSTGYDLFMTNDSTEKAARFDTHFSAFETRIYFKKKP